MEMLRILLQRDVGSSVRFAELRMLLLDQKHPNFQVDEAVNTLVPWKTRISLTTGKNPWDKRMQIQGPENASDQSNERRAAYSTQTLINLLKCWYDITSELVIEGSEEEGNRRLFHTTTMAILDDSQTSSDQKVDALKGLFNHVINPRSHDGNYLRHGVFSFLTDLS